VRYRDGSDARVSDQVVIDGGHRGRIVACLDRGESAPDYAAADWNYLERGLLIETDVGGLVHYRDAGVEGFELLRRVG
jgi:hypothetical protein